MAMKTLLYPIRAVSKLTGISLDTLRAWERRYKVVSPQRDERGLHLLDQRRGFAFVESGRPLIGDPRQRLGEVRLLEDVALFVRLAVLGKLRERRGILLEVVEHAGERSSEAV